MNGSTLCVGADIHLKDIVLRGIDQASGQEVLDRLRVPNNRPGAETAVRAITDTATELGYTHLEIGWEATGMLGLPLHGFLSTHALLQPFQVKLVCFNPKLVAGFKDALALRAPKSDERDALDVAARLRFGQLPVSYMPGDFWQGLRRLTRYRFRLSRAQSREKMRFQAYAFLKVSDWKRVKPFSDLFGATSAALLTEFTADELREMSHIQLAELIAHLGRNHFDDPHATARAVQRALRTSYPIEPQEDEMVTVALAASLAHIRAIQDLIKRLDQQITRYIEPIPNPLISVKGLGPVITAGILAEIVDISRFPQHKHLAQYMGLTWRQRSSGNMVSKNTRLTKVGNCYLRYYFIQGADKMRQFNLEYKAYYWRKYQQVANYQHKRALVLTARKLVRLVHALLTKNVPYVRPQTIIPLPEEPSLQ